MSSAAQVAANRTNAKFSSGPRTEEGKTAVRHNALAHSMCSKTVVLPHESQEEYDAILQGFIQHHKPATENERLLVEHLAQAHWRLQRCYGVERAFLENRIEASDADPDTAMANLFIDKAEMARMRLLMRYLGAAERAFNKAGSDLAKAQAARRKAEAEASEMEALAAAYAPVGFVSQPAPRIVLPEPAQTLSEAGPTPVSNSQCASFANAPRQ